MLGLSVGLACVVILVLFAQKCLTWDAFHANGDRIYSVQTQTKDATYNQTVYPVLEQMLHDYPDIETGTHVQQWNNPWISYGGKNVQESTTYVDSTFFQIFSFGFKHGNPATALRNRYSIVLTEAVAHSLFGEVNPVGKHVTLNDTLQYAVTGVLAPLPANSSLQFSVLLPAANLTADAGFRENANWYNTFARVFVLLKPGASKAALEAKFPQLVERHFAAEAQDRQLALSPYKDFIYTENPTFGNLITGAFVIAAFLLLIININLNMALAMPRAKEVAMRQVVGATKRLVLGQFWVESGLVVLAALVLSVGFAVYYLLPHFNQLRDGRMQLAISLSTDYPTILTVLAVALAVTLVAGTYPALYLMGLKTTDAVKGKLASDPTRGRQRALIVLQFTLAMLFILGTIGMREQINFMKRAALGYDKNNLLVFKTDLAYRNETTALAQGKAILNSLRQNPRVLSFTSSQLTPAYYQDNFNAYFPDGDEAKAIGIRHLTGAIDYFATYKIPMIEGRDFSDATPADSANHAVVINESAMKAFGWTTAVGKKLRQKSDPQVYTIVGVTKDFHYRDLKDKVGPVLHWYGGRQTLNQFLTVRLADATNAPAVIKDLETQFRKIPARRALAYVYMADEVEKAYQPIDNIWRMISFVSLVAILTACAGIFGLILLVARQRTKEIGVRKVLGASVFSITALLSSDFLRLAGIAIVFAAPLGWWLGNTMLSYFAYRTQTQWWYFVVAAALALALAIALISVLFQAMRAAMANPVKSLRSE